MSNCPLCELVANKNIIHTKEWYRDDSLMVINCDTCEGGNKIPMVVLKRHDMIISLAELTHILNIVYELYGGHVKLRIEQRKIKDHLHWHILK